MGLVRMICINVWCTNWTWRPCCCCPCGSGRWWISLWGLSGWICLWWRIWELPPGIHGRLVRESTLGGHHISWLSPSSPSCVCLPLARLIGLRSCSLQRPVATRGAGGGSFAVTLGPVAQTLLETCLEEGVGAWLRRRWRGPSLGRTCFPSMLAVEARGRCPAVSAASALLEVLLQRLAAVAKTCPNWPWTEVYHLAVSQPPMQSS